MTRQYYYFAASLPVLNFDGRPPFSVEDYLNECRRFLTSKDFSLVEKAVVVSDGEDAASVSGQSGILEKWRSFENRLRNEWAWFRADRAGQDRAKYLRGERPFDLALTDMIHQAGRMEDLLAAEKLIDRYRWNYLEELALGHWFDLEALVIYGIKLKMLARYQRLNSPVGKEIVNQLRTVSVFDTMAKIKA